jgi:RimJ/RimL family protein N-acetyltransferase
VAITSPDNYGSIRVLEKIGLRFETAIDVPEFEATHLYTPLASR